MIKINQTIESKTTVKYFLQKNRVKQKISINDLNVAKIHFLSNQLPVKKIRIEIISTQYIIDILDKNTHNIDIALLAIIMDLVQKKEYDLISKNQLNQKFDIKITKFVNKKIYSMICDILPDDKRSEILLNLGSLFHYYYTIRQ
jgi:hypothetical protein